MGFSAKVVLHSVNTATGQEIATMEWTYPRCIHSEILTHRDRARNSASSRAIPFPTMCERVTGEPFVPLQWLSEQKGMQGGAEIPEPLRPLARAIWLRSMESAERKARELHYLSRTAHALTYNVETPDDPGHLNRLASYAGMLTAEEYAKLRDWVRNEAGDVPVKIHKSLPNRLIEPWMWITIVMTATKWENLWRLRCHPDAEIHFQKIANMAREALRQSSPRRLAPGEWHLPYVTGAPDEAVVREKVATARGNELAEALGGEPSVVFKDCGLLSPDSVLLGAVSTARSSRVSYEKQGLTPAFLDDLTQFKRLYTGSGFGHWSPMEHPAKAAARGTTSGPFVGYRQFRKFFPQECA